jgi:hypothetical protein
MRIRGFDANTFRDCQVAAPSGDSLNFREYIHQVDFIDREFHGLIPI